MDNNQTDLLTDSLLGLNTKKRKELIPIWIKVFSWIFLIMGAIAFAGLILGVLGYNFQLELYGIKTEGPLSLAGLGLFIIFLFKGYTSYCIIQEKDTAIILGTIDAIIGIAICCLVMIYQLVNRQGGSFFTFRIELLLLIPYLVKLQKIKPDWENTIEI